MAAIKRLFGSFRSSREKKSESEAHSSIEWVVAGLGNPGDEYARSRHNAGFMTIELAGKPALLVKPQTFYNLSGECVADLLGYFKIPLDRLIVVHDELDIEAGRLLIKQGGGDAGNRGVRSIAEVLGATEFIRVRIGIGRPADPRDNKEDDKEANKDYLLRPMTSAERQTLESNLDRAASAVEAIAELGLERAMNRYNQRG
jgi:PTH1 family peptidyl-tRNA hydrolase